MVLSIAFALVYIVLVSIFPKKGQKTMPMAVRAAFMLGFPILAVLTIVQEKLIEPKYHGLLTDDTVSTFEDFMAAISPMTDFILPILIAFAGAIAVAIGVFRVLRCPISEEPSDFTAGFGGSLASEYQNDCASAISGWGIVLGISSLLMGVGFLFNCVALLSFLDDGIELALTVGFVFWFAILLSFVIPFAFLFAIPFGFMAFVQAAFTFVTECYSQLMGMMLFGFGFGLTYTVTAVISICASVRMKKSGSITTGKTILYIIGSLIPIVNVFVLGNIRKTVR